MQYISFSKVEENSANGMGHSDIRTTCACVCKLKIFFGAKKNTVAQTTTEALGLMVVVLPAHSHRSNATQSNRRKSIMETKAAD